MKPWLSCLLLLPGLGCVHPTSVTRIGAHTYDAKPKDCVIQVITQVPADRKFEEVALLTNIFSAGVPLEDVLAKMQAEACRLGADAILVRNVDKQTADRNSTAFAVAIKFLS